MIFSQGAAGAAGGVAADAAATDDDANADANAGAGAAAAATDNAEVDNDYDEDDDKEAPLCGGSVLARWLSNRKVAGSILLVVAFSRLGGFRVFNRVNTARPALSGGVRLSELRGHSFPWVTELEQGWPSCFSP